MASDSNARLVEQLWREEQLIVISAGQLIPFRDANGEKVSDASLKLQAEQYRLLFETNPSPMWVFDVQTLRILAVNQAAVTHYGYSREEFLQLTIVDLRAV